MNFQTPQNIIKEMFVLQRALIKEYIILEGLPPFPLDLTLKEHQNLLRKFSGRVTEELSESFEEYSNALGFHTLNEPKKISDTLQKFLIEIADTLHFYFEFLIYAGIDEFNLESKMEDFLRARDLMSLSCNNRVWGTIYNYLLFLYPEDFYNTENYNQALYDTGDENLESRVVIPISITTLENIAKNNWIFIYELNRALNFLKNKDWSLQKKELNLIGFQDKLIDSLISLVYLLSTINLSERTIYYYYTKKNKINHERIKIGY